MEEAQVLIFDKQGRRQGVLYVGRGLLAYLGELPCTAARRHPAMLIAVGLDAPMTVEVGDEEWRFEAVVLPADMSSAPTRTEGRIAFVSCAPHSKLHRALYLHPDFRDVAAVDPYPPEQRVQERLQAMADEPLSASRALDVIEETLKPSQPVLVRPLDARVEEVLWRLNNEPDGEGADLEALAAAVCLSPTRLAHLFKEQTGTSVRRYRTWARISKAALMLGHSRNLTEVAMAAGFTDLSHLSRSFREMIGISPSRILYDWQGIVGCEEQRAEAHG